MHRRTPYITLDAFEHFGDPEMMLLLMFEHLKPGGRLFGAFGPTWYHPLGGHLFSFKPWSHLLFCERALCAWRSHFRDGGAISFAEYTGGLNRMTVANFEQLVARSQFVAERIECLPIRQARPLHNRFTREMFTAIVRVTLRRPS